MTNVGEQARWLVAWSRGRGAAGLWSLLFNAQIVLLTLALDAPIEDSTLSDLAFDLELHLGILEAADPTLPVRGVALGLEGASHRDLKAVVQVLLEHQRHQVHDTSCVFGG